MYWRCTSWGNTSFEVGWKWSLFMYFHFFSVFLLCFLVVVKAVVYQCLCWYFRYTLYYICTCPLCMTINMTILVGSQLELFVWQSAWPFCLTFNLSTLHDTIITWPFWLRISLTFLSNIQLDLFCTTINITISLTFLFEIQLGLFGMTMNMTFLNDIQLDLFVWQSAWPFCLTFNLSALHDIQHDQFGWQSAWSFCVTISLTVLCDIQIDLFCMTMNMTISQTFLSDIQLGLFSMTMNMIILNDSQHDCFVWQSAWLFCMIFNKSEHICQRE